jgi:hypothetical protein
MFGKEYSNRFQKLYCATSIVHSMTLVLLGSLQSVFYVFYDHLTVYRNKFLCNKTN